MPSGRFDERTILRSLARIQPDSASVRLSQGLREAMLGGSAGRCEEIDEVAVRVAHEQRTVPPGHVGGLIDEHVHDALKGRVGRIDVGDEEVHHHAAIRAGLRGVVAEERHGGGTGDGQRAGWCAELGEHRMKPLSRDSGDGFVERDERVDVVGDDSGGCQLHRSLLRVVNVNVADERGRVPHGTTYTGRELTGIATMMDVMADTTARALQLLELLQSASQRTVAELADRLGVDERTIRRDVARLVDLGLPVQTVRGRYGGYRLASGQRVLPLMFSAEEAVAVFLGLTRTQQASREPVIAAQTALAKIKRALPADEAERVDALLGVMASSSPYGQAAPDPALMLTVAEAVESRRALDLRYVGSEGVPSRRTVHPYDLIAHSERWYLIAFDSGSQEERTFRVDRIRSARPLREILAAPRRPDAQGNLLDRFADADYRWRVVLHIRTTEERIRARLPRSAARLERLDGAEAGTDDQDLPWYRAEIRAESLDWLPSVIAALDCEVTIEGPDELRDRVRAAAARMLHAADDDTRPAGA